MNGRPLISAAVDQRYELGSSTPPSVRFNANKKFLCERMQLKLYPFANHVFDASNGRGCSICPGLCGDQYSGLDCGLLMIGIEPNLQPVQFNSSSVPRLAYPAAEAIDVHVAPSNTLTSERPAAIQ